MKRTGVLGSNALPASAQPDRARLVKLVEAQREFRDVLLSDPHRPTYHFVNPDGRGMPFDPNGAIFWNGKYHLCYIYQNDHRIAEKPDGKRNYDCWGHASSIDLLHWRFHKTALAPGDPDKSIYSGNCFINNKGEATMLYHGVGAGNSIARMVQISERAVSSGCRTSLGVCCSTNDTAHYTAVPPPGDRLGWLAQPPPTGGHRLGSAHAANA